LGGRKGIRRVKKLSVGAGVVICLERGADLHMAQLMPLPLTVSCFSKIQIDFTFLVPAHPGSPGKGAVTRVCVCLAGYPLCVCLCGEGDHLCEVNRKMHGSVAAARGTELPSHCHPQGDDTGRTVSMPKNIRLSVPCNTTLLGNPSFFLIALS